MDTFTTNASAEAPKARKGRSPNYPSLDLKTALTRAETLYRAETRHAAHFSTVLKHWGYTPKSGQGRLAFAALLKFGLIETSGEGAERSASVTDAAARIILDKRPDSAERKAALQALALRPRMHRELWTKYQGTLPSDDELRYRLTTDHRFTPAGADDFLIQFRKTLAFAEVGPTTPAPSDIEGEEDNGDNGDEPMNAPATTAHGTVTPTPPHPAPQQRGTPPVTTGPRVSFPLPGNNLVEVTLRSRVTRRDFEKIKKLLDLAEDSFVVEDEALE